VFRKGGGGEERPRDVQLFGREEFALIDRIPLLKPLYIS